MTYSESLEGLIEWYKMATDHADMESTVVVLIGNKCDLFEHQQVSRNVSQEMGKRINAAFVMEVSAKERICIDDML